jgi:anti-sigma regulatory factor (Ser/Thr protein kinase)
MSQTATSKVRTLRPARRHPLEMSTRVLESKLESLDSVERTAIEFAGRAGFHGAGLEKIGIAVHEVVANAIIHGNHFDSRKKVVVTFLRTAEQLEVSVWDQGAGFDLEVLPDPRNADVFPLPHGRGIYFARAFMDEFYVQAGPANGTTVSMIKNIPFDDGPTLPALRLAS